MEFFYLDGLTSVTIKRKYAYISVEFPDKIMKAKLEKGTFEELYEHWKKINQKNFYPLLFEYLNGRLAL